MSSVSRLPVELTNRIPQEIFDSIITNAGHSVLKQCSLVSHPWASTSRKCLFSYVVLFQSFTNYLATHPDASTRILSCVQHALLHRDIDATDGNLPVIVAKMTNLRILTFCGCAPELVGLFGGREETARNVREIWMIALGPFPTFTSIRSSLCLYSGLQTLLINGTSWNSTANSEGASGEPYPEVYHGATLPCGLKSVTLEKCIDPRNILEWLSRAHITVQALTLLDARRNHVDHLRRFTCVSKLTLGRFRPLRPPFPSFEGTLSECTNLKELVISQVIDLSVRGTLWAGSSCLQLSELLRSVASPLHRLALSVSWIDEPDLDRMDWDTLNSLLETSPFYAELEEIHISVSGSGTILTRARAEAGVRARLTGLLLATTLSFDYDDYRLRCTRAAPFVRHRLQHIF
ncbi:hypothetical protein DFP72DRAFT_890804 [Ephemerocybe angulata]|uniref:F-box domain-containing protein n=1 Tax=Ephemerocybe angulata TaxID=980116 RepID=A0A8H6I4L0_9AGAR|nr:hypothetical protein DFP72DRAFT_890804 [Tulosesus angulatus]